MKKTLKAFALLSLSVFLLVLVSSCGKKADTASDNSKKSDVVTSTEQATPGEDVAETEEAETTENAGEKFDQRLIEAIEHAETGGVNPYFAVDAVVDGNYTDAMVSQLEAKGVDVVYGEKNILRIRVTPKNLKEIKDFSFIKNFILIAENYYPNK